MKDRLDVILDEALAGYAGEPQPGIEQQVMRRVRSRGKLWPFALPVFAVAALVCWTFVSLPRVTPPVPVQQKILAPALAFGEKFPTIPQHRKAAPLPKREVFPSPVALSEGERALLALLNQHPETADVVIRTGLEPIEIQLLEIRPLVQTESGQ